MSSASLRLPCSSSAQPVDELSIDKGEVGDRVKEGGEGWEGFRKGWDQSDCRQYL